VLASTRGLPTQKLDYFPIMRIIEIFQTLNPAVRQRQAAELLEDGAIAGLPEPGESADLGEPGPALELGTLRDIASEKMTRFLPCLITGRQMGVLPSGRAQEPAAHGERGRAVSPPQAAESTAGGGGAGSPGVVAEKHVQDLQDSLCVHCW
jgi:hypothetical protein